MSPTSPRRRVTGHAPGARAVEMATNEKPQKYLIATQPAPGAEWSLIEATTTRQNADSAAARRARTRYRVLVFRAVVVSEWRDGNRTHKGVAPR